MTVMTRLIPAAAVLLMLSACASGTQKSAYTAPRQVGDVVDDDAYMAQVERVARRRGIGITWVNIPTRHVTTTEQ